MTKTTLQKKRIAAKARRTRLGNQAQLKYWREVTEPGMRRLEGILNFLVDTGRPLRLRWNPSRDIGRKLKHGVTKGTLVGFENGYLLRVLPDGYRRPLTFHPAIWELANEKR